MYSVLRHDPIPNVFLPIVDFWNVN